MTANVVMVQLTQLLGWAQERGGSNEEGGDRGEAAMVREAGDPAGGWRWH